MQLDFVAAAADSGYLKLFHILAVEL
jgi:hypothetical protein